MILKEKRGKGVGKGEEVLERDSRREDIILIHQTQEGENIGIEMSLGKGERIGEGIGEEINMNLSFLKVKQIIRKVILKVREQKLLREKKRMEMKNK